MKIIQRTCVDQRHQHDEVEEEVDDHGDDDLPVDLAEPLPVFLHSAVVNIPVLEREHNPTVLQGVGELLDHVDLPELLDNNELSDEDSHGLEDIEEDEQHEIVKKSETCVEGVVWRLRTLGKRIEVGVIGSVNERPSHRSELTQVQQLTIIGFIQHSWEIVLQPGSTLTDFKRHLLSLPVVEDTEETETRNKEHHQHQDPLGSS